MLTHPERAVQVIYIILSTLILVVLLLMTGREIKRQHYKHIAYGVLLIVIMLCLMYVSRSILMTGIFVL